MKIITEPNPILHQRAKLVTEFDDALVEIAAKMRATMHEYRGMGLAAPQVNLGIQLAVVEYVPGSNQREETEAVPFMILVNPNITWSSRNESVMTEGCLSIPGYEGEVSRPKRIKLKAQDVTGQPIILKASGLAARIIQHEVDHLNGILYTEKLVPGTELKTKSIKE